MAELGYQGDELSQEILTKLTQNLDFSIPAVDFNAPGFTIPEDLVNDWLKKVQPLTVDQLTEVDLDGNGVLDVILRTMRIHLAEEQRTGRIIGAEYAKAFIALTQVALQSAVQYLTTRDSAYWQAVQGQLQAVTSNINAFTAKTQLAIAQAQAHTTKAQYAQTVMTLGNEDVKFATGKAQKALTEAQTEQITAQTGMVPVQTNQIMAQTEQVKAQTNQIPVQTSQIEAQTAHLKEQTEQAHAQISDTTTTGSTITGILGKQKEMVTKQIDKLSKDIEHVSAQIEISKEQKEQVRAQTLDTRTDGAQVVGAIGKQKDLYSQQIDSYKKDAELKAAKVWSDAFTTQKSLDEGTVAPTVLNSETINQVLNTLKKSNNL